VEVAHESFSRVPVYRRNPDNIVGILHAKDLAARRLESAPPRVERLVRPAYFIPPGKLLGELFEEMRRGRFQIALVVNEYGRLLGLVTLEDLLEELFGEIRDEFDTEAAELTRISDDEWAASGAVALGKLADALAPAKIIETYGGGKTLSSLVLRRLGRVPRAGDKLRLGDFDATVERVRGAAVETVRLHR
ncbi:MAG TPA: CBS domain-containing protein, partial [Candidatus Binatus sp.]|nr:CBS domain-containing protein [Candidatus Binatus sp.]